MVWDEVLGKEQTIVSLETKNVILSSLVCADVRLNIHFSYTRDSYKSFLLCHITFSYVIVSQKIYCVKVDDFLTANDREKAVGGVGGG